MRPGCFDIHERVRDMDANGVLASLELPVLSPVLRPSTSPGASDKDLGLAVLRAYNDWHVDEWCGTYPGRMIPLSLPPIWDVDKMAEEVHRMAQKGCHAVTFSENPEKLGYPSIHSDHWDPFWQACSDENTVVCLHIGSSSQVVITSIDEPVETIITLQPFNIVQATSRPRRGLRCFASSPTSPWSALSEGGIGWIPYFLERVDRVYKQHRAWTHQDFGDKLPSEVFLERIVTCFIDDPFGIESRNKLNLDMITWECDYPHSDSSWPLSPELLAESLADVPDHEVAKIHARAALRLFLLRRLLPRPEPRRATVGALRAQATDVDLGYRSSARLKKVGTEPVSVLNLVESLPSAS